MMSRQEAMRHYGDTPMLFDSYYRGKFVYRGTACNNAFVTATCKNVEYVEARTPERLRALDPTYMHIWNCCKDYYRDEPDPPRYQP